MASYEYEEDRGIVFVEDLPSEDIDYRDAKAPEKWRVMSNDIQRAALADYVTFADEVGDTPKWLSRFIELAKKLMGLAGGAGDVVEDEPTLRRSKRLLTSALKLLIARARTPDADTYWSVTQHLPFGPSKVRMLSDDVFAHLRLAGMDPALVRTAKDEAQLDACADRNVVVQGIPSGDTLAKALAEGRLYVVPPEAFGDMVGDMFPRGEYEHSHRRRFVSAPTAVFYRSKGLQQHCKPLAIRCGRDLATIGPTDGNPWARAKLHFAAAESLHQTYVSHLPQSHLLMELAIIATRRVFDIDSKHPVNRLLRPHCEGTLAVNRIVRRTLIAEDSPFDEFIGCDSASARRVLGKAWAARRASFGTIFSGEIVDDDGLVYPWRDDYRRVAAALRAWVDGFVAHHYADDAAVAQNTKIQEWSEELGGDAGFGNLPDLGTRVGLQRMLGTLVEIASVQHASFHFPQTDIGRFVWLAPFYVDDVAPGFDKQREQGLTALDSLPDLHAAAWQAFVLGQSRFVWRPLTQLLEHASLKDERDLPFAVTLTNELAAIEQKIDERNNLLAAADLPRYEYLLPSNIPCSINA